MPSDGWLLRTPGRPSLHLAEPSRVSRATSVEESSVKVARRRLTTCERSCRLEFKRTVGFFTACPGRGGGSYRSYSRNQLTSAPRHVNCHDKFLSTTIHYGHIRRSLPLSFATIHQSIHCIQVVGQHSSVLRLSREPNSLTCPTVQRTISPSFNVHH